VTSQPSSVRHRVEDPRAGVPAPRRDSHSSLGSFESNFSFADAFTTPGYGGVLPPSDRASLALSPTQFRYSGLLEYATPYDSHPVPYATQLQRAGLSGDLATTPRRSTSMSSRSFSFSTTHSSSSASNVLSTSAATQGSLPTPWKHRDVPTDVSVTPIGATTRSIAIPRGANPDLDFFAFMETERQRSRTETTGPQPLARLSPGPRVADSKSGSGKSQWSEDQINEYFNHVLGKGMRRERREVDMRHTVSHGFKDMTFPSMSVSKDAVFSTSPASWQSADLGPPAPAPFVPGDWSESKQEATKGRDTALM
jgi:hypothetical protein